MESTLQRNFRAQHRPVSSSALSVLEQELDALLSRHADERTMQQIAVKLAGFASSHLHHALRELLQDEAALKRVADRSYVHGNGFYKLVLAERDNLKLRLHL